MKTYVLVNPVVSGNVETHFEAENSLDAANQAYSAISKYFSNQVKGFKFTLARAKGDKFDMSKMNGGSLLHFKVSEAKSANSDRVEFAIKPLKDEVTNVDNFKTRAARAFARVDVMTGGGKKSRYSEDEEDDSDSDEIVVKRRYFTEPIRYFYYYPFLYGDDRFYVPTFPFNVEYIVDFWGIYPTPAVTRVSGATTTY